MLIVLTLTIYIFLILFSGTVSGKDFLSYYFGAQMLSEGKTSALYSVKDQMEYQNRSWRNNTTFLLPFRGLPSTALIYLPFSHLAPLAAFKTFGLFLLGISILYMYLLSRMNRLSAGFFILGLLHPVFAINFLQGQPSLIILFTISLSLFLLKREQYFLSGLVLALSFLKIQTLPLILLTSILVRNRKYYLGIFSSLTAQLAFNIYAYGPTIWKDYLYFLAKTETPGFGSHLFASYSIKNLTDILISSADMHNGYIGYIVNLLLFLILAGIIITFLKQTIAKDPDKIYNFAIISGLLLGIHIIRHDLVLLFIPFMYLLKNPSKNKALSICVIIIFNCVVMFEYIDMRLNLISIFLLIILGIYYGKILLDTNHPETQQK